LAGREAGEGEEVDQDRCERTAGEEGHV
jgi:hypothetical protein